VRDHIWSMVKKEEKAWEIILQFYISVKKEEWKLAVMNDLSETMTIPQTIILYTTRRKVDWLTKGMHKMDITMSCMTGNMDQTGEDMTMREHDLSSISHNNRISVR
jgi:superfamily II DNA/RNA helicase